MEDAFEIRYVINNSVLNAPFGVRRFLSPILIDERWYKWRDLYRDFDRKFDRIREQDLG